MWDQIAFAQKRGQKALLSKVHQLIWLASIKKQKESLASWNFVKNPEKSRNKTTKYKEKKEKQSKATKNNEQENITGSKQIETINGVGYSFTSVSFSRKATNLPLNNCLTDTRTIAA